MKYQEYNVNKLLSKYIDCFWNCNNCSLENASTLVTPDTCTDIILRYFTSGNSEPEIFISGEMTKANMVIIPPKQQYLGIRFKPGFLSPFLSIPMSELTDQDVPLKDVNKHLFEICHSLVGIEDQKVQLQTISYKIKKIIQSLDGIDPLVEYLIKLIQSSNGQITIKELSLRTGYSARHIQRLFNNVVGLSPKLFARLVRFNKVKKDNSKRDCYYDQSHFCREYKEFMTPQ